MKIAPLIALGLIVSLAGCNDDRYTGKVEDAEDMAACYVEAHKAKIAYRTKLKLDVHSSALTIANDPNLLAKAAAYRAERYMGLVEMWEELEQTRLQMVRGAISGGNIEEGDEFWTSCFVAYITQEKVDWPDL